ncbi:hypothetical protein D3C78_873480 [compost metagenome]
MQALLLIVAGRLFGLPDAGGVAGLADRADQLLRIDLAEQLQVGTLIGQVDADALDPGHLVQGAFDATGARGAGHAANAQLKALRGHAVTGLLHRFHERRQAVRGRLDTGLLGGQVDADCAGAGHFAQRALHTPGATGAGHAGDRQVEGGGIGHRSYSL